MTNYLIRTYRLLLKHLNSRWVYIRGEGGFKGDKTEFALKDDIFCTKHSIGITKYWIKVSN